MLVLTYIVFFSKNTKHLKRSSNIIRKGNLIHNITKDNGVTVNSDTVGWLNECSIPTSLTEKIRCHFQLK